MKKRHHIKSVSSVLGKYFRNSGMYEGLREKELLGRWNEVVGEAVAEHVQLVDVRDGVLHLRIKVSVWKTEIQMQKKQIIQKSNQVLRSALIKDLRIE